MSTPLIPVHRARPRQFAIAGCAVLGLAIAPSNAGREGPLLAQGGARVVPVQRFVRSLPFHPYDTSWTFVRIWTNGGFGFNAGWAHDYPNAEINFSKVLNEFTTVHTRLVESGGNVLTFEDPRLFQFPIAYVSEPDEWRVTEGEAEALRLYLRKGGFVIFDDFFDWEMANLVRQMALVFPELYFLPLDGSEPIWNSFFSINPRGIVLEGPNKSGTPQFWGLYEDNDKSKRMLAVAGAGGDIGDLWEWSDRGYFPVDPTNEAYRIGINYIVYALTH
jgi:hypothetical protein